ncbi:hypothetical protein [Gemmobacter sp.]|uniref:hypothetical protein n=1 Tax=Gemmobacter sp. TaxID=1898957 RepID=UPI002AFED3C7|nr:hypothetical protein [Gemmobacter sp.]
MLDTTKPGAAPTALLMHLQAGACLTVDQVVAELGISRRQAMDAAAKLLRRNYLMKMAVGCFQLTDAGIAAAAAGEVITSGPVGKTGAVPVHKDTFRQRAWNSIRFNRRFTIGQIVRAAAREDEKNARENARKYIAQLCKAGILRELPQRAPGTAPESNGFKRFMLVRDIGRRAPVFRTEAAAVRDPNTGEDIPCTPR